MHVNAYAAPAAGQPLAPTVIERRDVGPNDVLIEIQYAGICHSDIHTVNGDWGPQPFPVVPGHEIVGIVTEVGSGVTQHQVGDRVGVGCMVNSCGECANCRNGDEQYCLAGMVPTYAGTDRDGTTTQGGYSTHVVVDADYVLSVPDGTRRRRRRAAAVRGHHHLRPAAPLGRRPRQEGRHRRARRTRPHGRQDRPRARRRGHRAVAVAEEAGGRAAARRGPLLRHLRPRRRSSSSPAGSTSSSTRSAPASTSTPTSACSPSTAPWSTSAPRLTRSAVNVFSLIGARRSFAGSMIGGIALDPGDARLLRRAQHRRRGRSHLRRPGQRGLRARPRLRRPLPLRHRHRHARLTNPPGAPVHHVPDGRSSHPSKSAGRSSRLLSGRAKHRRRVGARTARTFPRPRSPWRPSGIHPMRSARACPPR